MSNTLIEMYVTCELLDGAHKVFDEMTERNEMLMDVIQCNL